jgi:hypothetical protein
VGLPFLDKEIPQQLIFFIVLMTILYASSTTALIAFSLKFFHSISIEVFLLSLGFYGVIFKSGNTSITVTEVVFWHFKLLLYLGNKPTGKKNIWKTKI